VLRNLSAVILVLALAPVSLCASSFGNIKAVVHDPQHRPVAGATVTLRSATSDWSQTAQTNPDGEVAFLSIPVGDYIMSVKQTGFSAAEQNVTVISGSSPSLHFQLKLAPTNETVTVTAQAETASGETATPTTLITRTDIARTPGADRANSLAIITDFVPGAWETHDQLHVRGGHQVSWLIDGVEIPNTNIASNIGPQFNPGDIDYLEVQRGSYAADEGDRTYGIFNVVPRTGFERNSQAELVASAGNFYQSNDQLNFGSHTDRFAYYGSVNGNRSNLGIQTPVGQVLHDAENGYGGFGSVIFNASPTNQFRFVTSLRRDYYQIPVAPGDQQADGEHESDALASFSWLWTPNAKTVLLVAPFYHYNGANLDGSVSDFPLSTTTHHASRYAGGQATLTVSLPKNEVQAGFFGFGQHDNQLVGLSFNDLSAPNFTESAGVSGSQEVIFLEDKLKLTPWITVTGGVRQTHFSGSTVVENATSPRAGISVRIPRINVVLRGFYGDFYQGPPLVTALGPALNNFIASSSLAFIPLHGERDEEQQFGITVPFRGWSFDMDEFRTHVHNFFDHNSIGNSNAFFPITIDGALIRGWEFTLRSPRIQRTGQFHLAFSNQIAQGRGAINGGLTNFQPPAGFFLLDHDQRNTLNAGFDATLPWHTFASTNVYYGSGFLDGTSPAENQTHLPGHTTMDISMGKSFGENFSVSATALNVANRHLLTDNSLTFGGFHYNNPRELYVEVRYRFHYGRDKH
jgi:hypothetical protein